MFQIIKTHLSYLLTAKYNKKKYIYLKKIYVFKQLLVLKRKENLFATFLNGYENVFITISGLNT
jgi:hypothetical protein